MFSIEMLIRTGGYLGIFAIVFAESGLLVGFFLPGDSLLFSAGFLASRGYLNLPLLLLVTFLAAVLGDNAGYLIGKRVGPRIFNRPDSLLFRRENIEQSRQFYEKHGGKAIILARFTPVIRTFAPLLAGIGEMEYRIFVAYNIIGGLLWAMGITLLGFFLGRVVPDIETYILPIVVLVVLASVGPALYHVLKGPEGRKKAKHAVAATVRHVRSRRH
jgi:membrane-associated protein